MLTDGLVQRRWARATLRRRSPENHPYANKFIIVANGVTKIKIWTRVNHWLKSGQSLQALRSIEHHPNGPVNSVAPYKRIRCESKIQSTSLRATIRHSVRTLLRNLIAHTSFELKVKAKWWQTYQESPKRIAECQVGRLCRCRTHQRHQDQQSNGLLHQRLASQGWWSCHLEERCEWRCSQLTKCIETQESLIRIKCRTKFKFASVSSGHQRKS
mgnify:CR=1 FL=1